MLYCTLGIGEINECLDYWRRRFNSNLLVETLNMLAVGRVEYVEEPGTSVRFPKELLVPCGSSSMVLLGTGALLFNHQSLCSFLASLSFQLCFSCYG